MRDMDTKHLEIHSEIFDEIVEDIKQRNLSRNRVPKLIIGTGLSIAYGIPGMSANIFGNETGEKHKQGDKRGQEKSQYHNKRANLITWLKTKMDDRNMDSCLTRKIRQPSIILTGSQPVLWKRLGTG